MVKQKAGWISGIDSIRFFLALIVLLSHFSNPFVLLFKGSGSQVVRAIGVFSNHLFFGVGAVIAFFIISGFVIHYPYAEKDNFNVPNFLLRRWVRIGLPLIVIGAIAAYFHYFDRIPIWSLYCELIYYTLYPLLFRIKMSWRNKLYISFIISALVIVLFNHDNFSSLIHQRNINYNINYWYLGVSLTWVVGLPCWLLGVAMADKIRKVSYTVRTREIYFYRIGVFISGMIVFSLAAHFYVSAIFSLNLFAIPMAMWIEKEIVYYRNHEPVRVLEFFGKFSYSLYLCHELCIIFISRFLPLNVYTYLLYIAASIALAYVAYILVEYPAHRIAQMLKPFNTNKNTAVK